jgi:hypothetical protein
MIILTRDVNEILDKLGLSELTIVRAGDGTIQLAGKECNKPITTVSTIKVGKKLTKAERDILTDDYIMPILSVHTKALQSLIATTKDTKPEEDLELFLKEEEEDKDTTYNHIVHHVTGKVTKYAATLGTAEGTKCSVVYNKTLDKMSCRVETKYLGATDMRTDLNDGVLSIKQLGISIKKYIDLVKAVDARIKKLEALKEAMLITCAV